MYTSSKRRYILYNIQILSWGKRKKMLIKIIIICIGIVVCCLYTSILWYMISLLVFKTMREGRYGYSHFETQNSLKVVENWCQSPEIHVCWSNPSAANLRDKKLGYCDISQIFYFFLGWQEIYNALIVNE